MTDEKSGGSVLLFEDNLLNMKLAADLLELAGFQVLKAYDGEEGLEILGKKTPDLILLDISLPGIDGLEFFREIRTRSHLNGVKVVAITAQVMKEEESVIRRAGFDGIISKPIDTTQFVKTMKEMLAGR